MAVKPKPKRNSFGPTIHLRRHALHKLGKTVEEIAADEGVKPSAIRNSIQTVDSMRLLNTPEIMTAEMIDTVISRKKKLDQALDGALEATMGKGGSKVPDHATRLRAIGEVRQLVHTLQPRANPGRPISFNVSNTAASGSISSSVASSETRFVGFEERLREVRAKIDQHNQLPPPDSIAAPETDNEIDEGEVEIDAVNPESEPISE